MSFGRCILQSRTETSIFIRKFKRRGDELKRRMNMCECHFHHGSVRNFSQGVLCRALKVCRSEENSLFSNFRCQNFERSSVFKIWNHSIKIRYNPDPRNPRKIREPLICEIKSPRNLKISRIGLTAKFNLREI